ncbi:MAG: mechanosensitive ion channel family protein [Myxococcota bacterium]
MERYLAYLENRYVRAAVVLLASLVLARVATFVINRVLGAMAKRTQTDADDRALEVLRSPVVVTVLFVGLNVAATALQLEERPRFYIAASLKTVGIIVWTRALLKLTGILLAIVGRRAKTSALIQPRTVPVFEIFGKVIVSSLAVYFVFLAWRIDLTAWLASAGIAGIAVGFAAKDTLANLFSGLFIVADAPYKVGDVINLDSGLRGRVLSIGLRSTRLLTMDDLEITVPNALIAGGMIVNEMGGPSIAQRVGVTVDAAYGSDIDHVHETLQAVVGKIENVRSSPKPQVLFTAFGASGLTHLLYVWIDDALLKEKVLHQMHTEVYKAFADAGIEIPYSKHDVYIKEFPVSSKGAPKALQATPPN